MANFCNTFVIASERYLLGTISSLLRGLTEIGLYRGRMNFEMDSRSLRFLKDESLCLKNADKKPPNLPAGRQGTQRKILTSLKLALRVVEVGRKVYNHTLFSSMGNEVLKIKKLRSYRNAFWAFLILTYAIGRAGEMIKQSGGTSEGTAIFIVAVQAISPLVMIFCGIMWIKLKREKSTS